MSAENSNISIPLRITHSTGRNSWSCRPMVPSRFFLWSNKKRAPLQRKRKLKRALLYQAKQKGFVYWLRNTSVTAESIQSNTFRFNLQYLNLYIGSNLNSVYRFTSSYGMHCFLSRYFLTTEHSCQLPWVRQSIKHVTIETWIEVLNTQKQWYSADIPKNASSVT
jgi:hypothetical protein